MLYIGIDLGTTSVKLLLMDESGNIKNIVAKEYPLYFPKSGWSEQNPQDWLKSTIDGLNELVPANDKENIVGICISGQMMGLVVLDEQNNIIRPAILWNDGRSSEETEYLNSVIGKQTLSENTANVAFAAFSAPKILWLKKNEPDNFRKIKKILLPKDFLAFKFSGQFCTDVTDASGTLLLDVKNRKWSKEMLKICEISEEQLPRLYESYEIIGNLTTEIAQMTGLSENVKIIAGAGDNEAAAIGTGAVSDGDCNISIGTSGTVFITTEKPCADKYYALHSHCHSAGNWHLIGVVTSAASCNKWWCEKILGTNDFSTEQLAIKKLGENRVFFAPYLMGDRTPHNDSEVKAAFLGMSLDTTRTDMTQAVLEGVAFGLRESIELARKQGIKIEHTTICGGGAKSALWKRIIANVLNLNVSTVECQEGAAFGAAILATVGCGEYESVEEAAEKIVRVVDTIEPDTELVKKYEEKFQQYLKLYPSIKHFT